MNAIAEDFGIGQTNNTMSTSIVSGIQGMVDQLVKQDFFFHEAAQFLTDISPSLDKFGFDITGETYICRISNSVWELKNSTHIIKIEFFTPRSIEIIGFSKKEA